jgi:O-antigen/teichoic acid export membrane protein
VTTSTATPHPKLDRGAIVVRNVGLGFLSQFWFVALSIVTTPYIVRHLGADLYGLYILISAILGYFAFLDLGLGAALTKYLAEYEAAGREDAVSRSLQTALAIWLGLGVAGAAVLAIATPWLLQHVFSVPARDAATARFAFYIAALGFMVNLPGQTFGIVPAALQRFDMVFWRTVFFGTASIVLTVLALYAGYGLGAIVLVNLGITLATTFAFYLQARKLLPSVRFWPHLHRREARTLVTYGGLKASQRFAVQLIFQLDRIVVGAFSPISAVAYYAVPVSLTQRIVSLVGNVAVAVFPAASALTGADDRRRIEELYLRSMKLTALIALPISAMMLIYAHEILRYWIGPEFELKSSTVLMILAIANLGYAFTSVPSNTLDATGRIRVSTAFGWLAAATNVGLVFALVPTIGYEGAAWAVLANAAVMVPFYLYYIHVHVFEIGIGVVSRRALARPLLAILVLIAPMIWARALVSSLLDVAALVVVTELAYLGASIACGSYDDRDRMLLRTFFRRRSAVTRSEDGGTEAT